MKKVTIIALQDSRVVVEARGITPCIYGKPYADFHRIYEALPNLHDDQECTQTCCFNVESMEGQVFISILFLSFLWVVAWLYHMGVVVRWSSKRTPSSMKKSSSS
jgi:5,10-methenyltetrahydromethanopterin hydrogenase